jgi:hypothetical protein
MVLSYGSFGQAGAIESPLENFRLARGEAWEFARWLFAGVAVTGIAFVVLRDRRR